MVESKGEDCMHIRYSTDDYEKLDGQHNIMVLVGNGFDIAVLNKFGDKKNILIFLSMLHILDYVMIIT